MCLPSNSRTSHTTHSSQCGVWTKYEASLRNQGMSKLYRRRELLLQKKGNVTGGKQSLRVTKINLIRRNMWKRKAAVGVIF